MDFQEKAKIRIEHWLSHNESHVKEYEEFMQKGPHLEFSCPGCQTTVPFSVLGLPDDEYVAP